MRNVLSSLITTVQVLVLDDVHHERGEDRAGQHAGDDHRHPRELLQPPLNAQRAATRPPPAPRPSLPPPVTRRSACASSPLARRPYGAKGSKTCPEPFPRIANFNLTQPAQLRVD